MALQFQPRDMQVLKSLFESRLMTLAHIGTLFFGGSKEAAKKRVQRLKSEGFLRERPRESYEPSLLFLTRKGLLFLHQAGALDAYPDFSFSALDRRFRISPLTIRHEVAVVSIRVAMTEAIRRSQGLSLTEFSTWCALYEFSIDARFDINRRVVQPDGFIRIESVIGSDKYEDTFFLEVDRGTETLERFVKTLRCYPEYFRSGRFAKWRGGSQDRPEAFPFRVLVICKSEERCWNIARLLAFSDPPIFSQVMLSTQAQAVSDPLAPIWILPKDHACRAKRISLFQLS
jgi:hypothetical protein